jgi:hypothetical protein
MVIDLAFSSCPREPARASFRSSPGSQPPHLASHPAAERRPTVATQRKRLAAEQGILAVDFRSDPNLKPTEIQPPTIEQRTPAVLARKPAPHARLKHALRKVGTIALNGGMLGLMRLKNSGFLIKSSLLDKRVALAIGLLITFCSGLAAGFAWRSSKQVPSVRAGASVPVALSPTLKEQIETMSSGLAAIGQSIDKLANGLGQMRRDITDLQTTEQAVFDKTSESPPRPAGAPPAKSTPRRSHAPTPAR